MFCPLRSRPQQGADQQQEGEHRSVLQGFPQVSFDQPDVVNYSRRGAEVDESVESLPAFAAKLTNRPLGRRQSQWNHEHEGGHAGSNETALADVGEHLMHIEEFIQPNVRHEVQAPVEESKQAQHAAQADHPVLFRDFPQWSDRQGDQKEGERPIPRTVSNGLDRIRPEIGVQAAPYQTGKRHQAG